MVCPICGSPNLFRSRSANASLARPLAWFAVWVRCHTCWHKFLRFGVMPARRFRESAVGPDVEHLRQAS